MAFKSLDVTSDLQQYVQTYGIHLDEIQRDLIVRTAQLGEVARNQISPDQGEFLTMLVCLMGAKYAVEVGTFTGYSALCIARGLPDDGCLVCCEISDEWTAIAQGAWRAAGVADRIDLRIGPASDTLDELDHRPIDFAFVDANKAGYWTYYNQLLPRIRVGGLIVFDNVLFRGEVVRPATSTSATAIHDFNRLLAGDARVRLSMLAFGDGMTLAQKVSRT